MDSISKNQVEDARSDVDGAAAIDRIREVVEDSESCFFCTAGSSGDSEGTRPMTVQRVDDAGNLWFLSARDSHKNLEIASNSVVRLFFQSSKHSGFLCLTGSASITSDKHTIAQLWKPILKTWFTEGVEDPRITVIAVAPRSGYYWGNKHGDVVAGAKMMVGAALGRTLDDSIEGKLSV